MPLLMLHVHAVDVRNLVKKDSLFFSLLAEHNFPASQVEMDKRDDG